MKKLILLLIPLILSGCYDYSELNKIAIISGIGIDYEDDKYEITYEIMSTKKESDTSSSTSTYNVTAKGKSLAEAFKNNGNNLDKNPYFEHVEIVVISEEVAKNHLQEVSEYFIRTSTMRNEFTMVIADGNSAKDVISTTTTEKPVAATYILSMLESSKSTNSAGYFVPFTKTLRNILTPGEDAIMSTVKIKNKEITLSGLGVFHNYELRKIFNSNEASIINLLNNAPARTVFFENKCDNTTDKNIIISLYESNLKIEPNNDYVKISGKLDGRINENNCDYDLKDTKVYKELESEFTKIITKKMTNVLKELQEVESNALSIGKNYYNKYRTKNEYLWLTQDFKYDLNFKLNKKGLVFTVK